MKKLTSKVGTSLFNSTIQVHIKEEIGIAKSLDSYKISELIEFLLSEDWINEDRGGFILYSDAEKVLPYNLTLKKEIWSVNLSRDIVVFTSEDGNHEACHDYCMDALDLLSNYYESTKDGFKTVESNLQDMNILDLDELVLKPEDVDLIIHYCERVFGDDFKDFSGNPLPNKCGMLLYGPPGNGKTSIAKAIAKKYNASLYVVKPGTIGKVIDDLTTLDSRAVVLLEEADSMVNKDDPQGRINQSDLQSVLDGSVIDSKVIFIATTNNPEKLESVLVNRPGRFSLKIKLENPEEEMRRQYFDKYFNCDDINIREEFVSKTTDQHFDFCHEVLVRASMYTNLSKSISKEEAILKSIDELLKQKTEEQENKLIGF